METINYEKSKFVKEEYSLTIENPRHCFFSGISEYNGQDEYLGIYTADGREKIVFIGHDKTIRLIADMRDGGGRRLDISKFYSEHRDCDKISENAFFAKLHQVVSCLGLTNPTETH